MGGRALLSATLCHMSTPTPLDGRKIGKRIADRRVEKRIEQVELAERAGLSRAYVSRLEGGSVQNPKVFDLERLAGVLDLSLPELLAPETRQVQTRYSLKWQEFQRQVENLPVSKAEPLIQRFQDITELIEASDDDPPGVPGSRLRE